jgi:tRNA dimethylallyltransferase
VISVDSRQVYRGMDIGTAKPTRSERGILPHHLIDVADPGEVYSAGRFVRESRAAIASIRSRGKIPLLAGGTGFYLKALAEGTLDAPPSDESVRAGLRREAGEAGTPALYERLRGLDPGAAARIHPNDLLRIVRALEILALARNNAGPPRGELRQSLPLSIFVLNPPRAELYRRLDERVDRMLREGFVEEVRALVAAGCREDMRSMQGIGYRQVAGYLAGRCSLQEAVDSMKQATRNFAKRQMTWFRGMKGAVWLDLPPSLDILPASREIARAIVGEHAP